MSDSGTDTDDEVQAQIQRRGPAGAKPVLGGPAGARPVPGSLAAPRGTIPVPPVPLRPPPAPRAPPKPPAAKGGTGAKPKAAPKRPAGAITLRTLLDAGFLVPGSKVLYVEYKGLITWADLTEEATIMCDGQTFESPSAFSIFVKRKLNPERKADDGWKAVKYAGKLLEHYKEQYLRQQLAASGRDTPGSSSHYGDDDDGPPNKRQRMDGAGLKIKLKLKDGPGSPTAHRGPTMPLGEPSELEPIECGQYAGAPGSGEQGAQPFRVEISELVVIVMDFHAHCSATEVGGLLAGSFDEGERLLKVTRVFPVLEAPASAAATYPSAYGAPRPPVAVEFDPIDLARVTEVIKDWGLTCVGSYRSHPAYYDQPNALDVLAQATAQARVRTAGGAEPSVCAIISPFDPAMTTAPASAITWFHVERDDPAAPLPALPPPGSGAAPPQLPPGLRPMAVALETSRSANIHLEVMNLVSTQFQHTARTYAQRPTRVPLALPWRPPGTAPPVPPPALPANAWPVSDTCLDKLVSSVTARLPEVFEGDLVITYGSMVRDTVSHEFQLAERQRAGLEAGGPGGSLAAGRSRRPARVNGALQAYKEFGGSDEEETEEDEDEVKLDDDSDDVLTDDD
ncbi:hypothetical protein CHLRE_13g589050v5 [Chlamydomonas reinhardtii]|uniref:RAMA domain-containing protein n=1 Tax=Chlamydomonas reinhardtii TaxID=3055 RepID=A0A2K3D0Y7_CHLRE|nr:uncharacterized protein CHLRE_13g589050v5 [Chlamydomonas reinhardtii]PNW74196.1 hypothetical protein CHLRE_13g589050v5 [Chlamydomonas reinhardtii]